jgi:hypothetical protein
MKALKENVFSFNDYIGTHHGNPDEPQTQNVRYLA